MRKIVCILLELILVSFASAQVIQDSVKIHFRTGKTYLDLDLGKNRQVLEDIREKLQLNAGDSMYYRLQKVLVVGGASPEGSISLNKRLSEKRAETLFNYLAQYGVFPDSLCHYTFLGRDWEGLYRLANDDLNLPYRDETLALLLDIIRDVKDNVGVKTDAVRRLQSLHGGEPYRYMYCEHFSALRASGMYLWYRPVTLSPLLSHTSLKQDFRMEPPLLAMLPVKPETSYTWAVKTNALYDLFAIPNMGIEAYWGEGWSLGGNWMYAWWKHDHKHWYWRAYGGDVYVRRWFGKQAGKRPLTGYHAGIYAQMLTYDFATGGRGYMGGKPGGNLWNKASWGMGIEYGYSHPIAERMNLDFTIGLGYFAGEYHEYLPVEGCYVWQATKNRQWFGPTKAEVSLVWLFNMKNLLQKGGIR